jgi:hypothetical protein
MTPSRDKLASVFAEIRKADWPQDLDEALGHPLYGRLIMANAKCRTGYVPAPKTPVSTRRREWRAYDIKKAQANDDT